jgi:hypothetical protein
VTKNSKILFSAMDGRDVYNITAPFNYRGMPTIAGRVEKRSEELSEIHLFQEKGNRWNPLPPVSSFAGLQDPCITRIDGKLLLGGVRFPVTFGEDTQAWQMEFHLANDQGEFVPAWTGPPKMKDIRFLQLANGEILTLTRPQGNPGGRGKIGYCITPSLESLNPDKLLDTPLLDLCPEDQWVGGNEAHLLSNGQVGVLGHIARFGEKGERHYYSMAFALDPATGTHSPCEIIARRKDFPSGPAKRADLEDVIFSGGLLRMPDRTARLFAGLSDVEAGWLDLPDPFVQYEN